MQRLHRSGDRLALCNVAKWRRAAFLNPTRFRSLQIERLENRCLLTTLQAADSGWVGGQSDLGFEAFQIPNSRWTSSATNGGGLQQGDPTTLTWSFADDGTSIPGFSGESAADSTLIAFLDSILGSGPGGADLTQRPWFSVFTDSFARLSALSGLTFVYESNDDGAAFSNPSSAAGLIGVRGDIRIGGHPVDGEEGANTLAYNFFPNNGEMVIDTDNAIFYGGAALGFRNVVMHEASHGLGISHVISTGSNFLMEPNISYAFDGPQLDDILALQRHYGDALEKNGGNDSFSSASDLGAIAGGSTVSRGANGNATAVAPTSVDFVSIDDESDVDYFKFTVGANVAASITLTPRGTTYSQGPQAGPEAPFNSAALSDLSLQLMDSNGSTVLQTANTTGAGAAELISNYVLVNAGTYYLKVSGTTPDQVQLYGLDVSITADPGSLSAVLADGTLTISDSNGKHNQLTISRTSNNLVITDATERFLAAPPGGTLSNGNKTLTIPLASITAGLVVDGAGGNDLLSVDFSGGNPLPSGGIAYEGGPGGNDSLTMAGGTTTSVTHQFTNENDGSVILAGSLVGTITYTGLESITDNLDAADRSFTFNGGSETITITDHLTAGVTSIDSTRGEIVHFANPTASLTINAGAGNDTVALTTIDPDFKAALTINGDAGNDTVRITGTDINFSSGHNLDLDLTNDAAANDIDRIIIELLADITLSGSGAATLKASESIQVLGATLRTEQGTITLEANQQAVATAGNFAGISISNSGLLGSTIGAINLKGRGGTGSESQFGVLVDTNGIVGAGTTGQVSITGVGGPGSLRNNIGVRVTSPNSKITSGGGNILVTGTGATSNSSDNYGVHVDSGGGIVAEGSGSVTIVGTGGAGSGAAGYGVFVSGANSLIRAGNGDINISAAPGIGSTSFSFNLTTGGQVSTVAAGAITVAADRMNIDSTGSLNAGTNDVVLLQRTTSRAIHLGAPDTATNLGLTDAELDRITAGTLQIGNTNSGPLAVNAPISHPNHLSLITGAGIAINDSLTLAVNKNFSATAHGITTGTIDFTSASSDLTATGTGSVTLTTVRDIELGSGSSITTAAGPIFLSANAASTNSGSFEGIDVFAASIASASGNITLLGRGGSNPATSQVGVFLQAGAAVTGGGNSLVSVTGVGGINAGASSFGVSVTGSSSRITSALGNLSVTGTGGTGTGGSQAGIRLDDLGSLRTAGGDLSATGLGGGNGASTDNRGIEISLGADIVAGGSGSLTLLATGGHGVGHGLRIRSPGSTILTNGGPLQITAVGSGAASALLFETSTAVSAGGTGSLHLIGDSIDIQATATITAAGTVTILPRTAATQINLGSTTGPTAGILELSAAELNQITAETLQIGDSNSGAVTISAAIARPSLSTVVLTTGNHFVGFNGGSLNVPQGTVTITTGPAGSITADAAATDVTTGSLSITSGSGGIGSASNPLRIAAVSLSTNTNVATPGPQYLLEPGSVVIGAAHLDAGTATITLQGGQFFTTDTGNILSPVVVNAAATLGGTGIVLGDVVVNSLGKITGGTLGGIGTLTVGTLAFNGGTYFADQLDNASDAINVGGTLNLASPTPGVFELIPDGTPSDGHEFVFLNSTSTNALINPPFIAAAQDQTIQLGGKNATYSYAHGPNGNDFALTVFEPLPVASIVVDSVSSSEAAGSVITFTVSLSTTFSKNVAIPYSVSGTSNNADYTNGGGDFSILTNGTVAFSPGQTSKTIKLQVTNDSVVEADETVVITLSAPVKATLGTAAATHTITNDDQAIVSIASAAAQEGSDIAFTITLSNAVDIPTAVTFTTSDGTAMQGNSDYTPFINHVVSFAAGSQVQTVTLSTLADNTVEADETFDATLGGVIVTGRNVTLSGVSVATATILNDDAAVVSISGTASSETNSGTTNLPFIINLSNPVDVPVTVQFSTANGTAVAPADYASQSAVVIVIPAGATSVSHNVVVNGDTIIEPDETFTGSLASLAASGRNVALSSALSATGTITNDDGSAVVAITTDSTNRLESDTAVVTFTVSLNGVSSQDVTVGYSIAGTATSGSDYVDAAGDYSIATAGLVTIPAGQTSKILKLRAINDNTVEANESIVVTLSDPSNASLGTSAAMHTITNDDNAMFTISSAAATEGAEISFTITLSNPVDVATSVTLTTSDGTATAADYDYTPISGQTVTFSPGVLTQTIAVLTTADFKVEAHEAFTATVGGLVTAGRNVTLGSTPSAGGTINNDDQAIVSITPAPASEGSGVAFTISLSQPVDVTTTVSLSTLDGTATLADNDYAAANGEIVSFSPGTTSQTFTVLTTTDTKVEADETFMATLGSLAASGRNVTLGSAFSAVGAIHNDDQATFSIAAAAADEGSSVVFTVTLSNPVDVSTIVTLSTNDGSALVANGDYSPISGHILNFAAGETRKTLAVSTNADNIVEAHETFTSFLDGLIANGRSVTLSSSNSAIGVINNDDHATFSIMPAEATEGGDLTFTIGLTHPVDVPISIAFDTTDATALLSDSDYIPSGSQTLNFAPGDISKTVTVKTTADNRVEDHETLTATLGGLTANGRSVVLSSTTSAIGTITNDDHATISIAPTTAIEGDGLAFLVTLSNPVDVAVSIQFATADSIAQQIDGDYISIVGQTITFAAGDVSKQVNVSTVSDNKVEADETVLATLKNLDAGGRSVALAAVATANGTIINDDSATFSISPAEGPEGGELAFLITLSNPVDIPTTLTFSTADGTAFASENDYAAVTEQVVTFAAGEVSKSVAVQAETDSRIEDSELFSVSLGGLVANGRNVTLSVAGGSASGTIIDVDSIPPTVLSFLRKLPLERDTNADNLTFTVTFSEPVSGVAATDFVAVGTTAMLTVVEVTSSIYDVTLSGGDLDNVNGLVGLNLASATTIFDAVGNAFAAGEPTADEVYLVDNLAPVAPAFAGIAPDTGASSDDNSTSDPTLTLFGTAEPHSTLEIIQVGLGSLGMTTADADGLWSYDNQANVLPGGTHKFLARSTDTAGNASDQSASFEVQITPWRNPDNHLDIDGDGEIVAMDALLILNRLNLQGSGPLPAFLPEPFDPSYYYDADGDNNVAPVDVLEVINYLNTHPLIFTGPIAEGEAPPVANTSLPAQELQPFPWQVLGSEQQQTQVATRGIQPRRPQTAITPQRLEALYGSTRLINGPDSFEIPERVAAKAKLAESAESLLELLAIDQATRD